MKRFVVTCFRLLEADSRRFDPTLMEKQITDSLFFLLDLYVDDGVLGANSRNLGEPLEKRVAEMVAFHVVRSLDDSGVAVKMLQRFPNLW